jgi:hypothetical protein
MTGPTETWYITPFESHTATGPRVLDTEKTCRAETVDATVAFSELTA